MDHLGYARLLFKGNTGAQTALGLSGKRSASQSGYARQGLNFYTNALGNDDWKAILAKKGIDEAELSAMRDRFKSLDTLSAAQQKETGEAQEATRRRDTAYDALHHWTGEFRETAAIALRKFPEMLGKLGLA